MQSFIIMAAILVAGSSSFAAVKNFNEITKEASVSEKILRRRLLQSLQKKEIAIAANNNQGVHKANSPSQDFEVRLVKRSAN